MSVPEWNSISEPPAPLPLQSSQPSSSLRSLSSGSSGSSAGGAGKCQLLLRTPPDMVSITVPSSLTLLAPTISKSPVLGLIDHKSITVPGA